MTNGQIFISYRRDDAAGYARALYDRLVQHFSPERVFMDVDAIEPGLAFDEAIQQALERCQVLLVVIGKHWLDAPPGQAPRINDPGDFVRLEIAAALMRDIRVIPVLLDGARMPAEAELPEPLRALARRNALEVSNSRFQADAERLISAVRKAIGETGGHRGVNGEWEAEVTYDWPNACYVEHFAIKGEGDEVYGTASFLGKPRGILDGRIEEGRLYFITRTREYLGSDSQNPRDVVHRYRGKFLENGIKFVMQTEGGYSEHIPIEFTARRQPSPSGQPTE